MNRAAGNDVIDTVVLPATPSRRPVVGQGPASDPTVPGISEVHASAELHVPADIHVAPDIHVPAPPAVPSAESVTPAGPAVAPAPARRA